MSQDNVEILRRTNEPLQGVDVAPFIRAALTGDTGAIPPQVAAGFAAWLNLFDPDVELDTSRMDMPGFGLLRGRGGIRGLWSRWIEEWEHYSWTHSNLSAEREHVIVDVEIHATGASSGVDVAWKQSQIYTFRDGKVIRWTLFNDRASALSAIEEALAGDVAGERADSPYQGTNTPCVANKLLSTSVSASESDPPS